MAVSFERWLRNHLRQIKDDPIRGVQHALYTLYLGLYYSLTTRRPFGSNVFEDEWDLLIILDACRVDILENVMDEYEFLDKVESRWSVGSHSHEWLAQTFRREFAAEIANTAYVTGNGHTHQTFVKGELPPDETVPFLWPAWNAVDKSAFGRLEMLWETAHQDKLGVVPRAITDRTVELHRELDPDRLIAHYMQPHIPYIAGALEENRAPNELESRGWKQLETGEADRDEVWNLYEANLRLVLDEVELLLENVDADKVVITADHGNEFGAYSIYGHPEGFLLPSIKQVPWVATAGTDHETYEPTGEYESDDAVEVEDHLRDLGYL